MIIAAVAATAIGIVGGTAFTVVTHEPASVAADSMGSETHESALHEATAAQATDDEPGADAAPNNAPEPSPGDADSAAADAGAARPAAEPAPVRARPAASPRAAAEEEDDGENGADQLARIFTAMQPRDAARVLSQLTDAEIREILTRMGARQAASVLSNMEPERAAILSRTVLDGGRSSR
jgi:hypothetical protein